MPARPLLAFRLAFASIWLVYDALDLAGSSTAHLGDWVAKSAPPELVALQAGLIASQIGLLLLGGRWVYAFGMVAAMLRAREWYAHLRLNDFAYYVVTVLVLAHATGPGLVSREKQSTALRWPRDVLVWQAAWMYLATGFLKLNPSWLSGGHLFVRFEYLAALGWPFPGVVRQCVDSLSCDRVLAFMGVTMELGLGSLLFFYPRRRVVLPVAIALHGFAAAMTNVWFFGPSLVAQLFFLTGPTERAPAASDGPRSASRAPRAGELPGAPGAIAPEAGS